MTRTRNAFGALAFLVFASSSLASCAIDGAGSKKAIDEPASTLADLRKAKTDLEQKMHWVERRASVYSLGQEFAQTPHLGEPTSPCWRRIDSRWYRWISYPSASLRHATLRYRVTCNTAGAKFTRRVSTMRLASTFPSTIS